MIIGLLAAATAIPTPTPGPAEPLLTAAFGPSIGGMHRAPTTTSWKSVQETVTKLRSICSHARGKLDQISKANEPFADREISLAGEKVSVSRRGLWRLAGVSGALYTSYSRRCIYDGYFASTTEGYRQAFKYDDPFGAYGCSMKKDGPAGE